MMLVTAAGTVAGRDLGFFAIGGIIRIAVLSGPGAVTGTDAVIDCIDTGDTNDSLQV